MCAKGCDNGWTGKLCNDGKLDDGSKTFIGISLHLIKQNIWCYFIEQKIKLNGDIWTYVIESL